MNTKVLSVATDLLSSAGAVRWSQVGVLWEGGHAGGEGGGEEQDREEPRFSAWPSMARPRTVRPKVFGVFGKEWQVCINR